MVSFSKIFGTVVAASMISSVIAHPGEHHDADDLKRQIAARQQMASAAKRSLSACASTLRHRQLNTRSVSRRANIARDLREKRGITSSEFQIRTFELLCNNIQF